MKSLFTQSSAVISECGKYRYSLTRTWDDSLRSLSWVMLNPSTADADQDDPTIRRCLGFAQGWGYGGIKVFNLFAWRATDPVELRAVEDPVGPFNTRFIQDGIGPVSVAAWGSWPSTWFDAHEKQMLQFLRRITDLRCLGFTKNGRPRHPLYMPACTSLHPFPAERG